MSHRNHHVPWGRILLQPPLPDPIMGDGKNKTNEQVILIRMTLKYDIAIPLTESQPGVGMGKAKYTGTQTTTLFKEEGSHENQILHPYINGSEY